MRFQSPFRGETMPQIISQGSSKEYISHNKDLVLLEKNVFIFLKIVLFFLMIYVGFQSSFRGERKPQITSQGSLKEYIDHNKGDRILGSLWKKNVRI